MTDSVVGNRHKNCLPCRLVSGAGVLGMGIYVWVQAQKRPQTVGRFAMYGVAAVAGGVGLTRILDSYPFGNSKDPPKE
ncbi:uncharacterized protein LOC131684783 [Topomyia yanbarensis]|uniref:uncharacterized protein LOC131684783 n=1 Tax=Topomyia yanbarensis TaxID=2498891 RepID=UPI00273C8B3A|nr:uncharacterized protein LOC131684783 [Topomyia yanbarensis]